jgi:hypothetical protein
MDILANPSARETDSGDFGFPIHKDFACPQFGQLSPISEIQVKTFKLIDVSRRAC